MHTKKDMERREELLKPKRTEVAPQSMFNSAIMTS